VQGQQHGGEQLRVRGQQRALKPADHARQHLMCPNVSCKTAGMAECSLSVH
jgi:hypothetical protein